MVILTQTKFKKKKKKKMISLLKVRLGDFKAKGN